MHRKVKRNRWFLVILSAITLFAIEGGAYLGERILVSKGVIYQPFDLEQNGESLISKMDPLLGWPDPSRFGKGEYDRSGSRVIPAFPDPDQESCVSAYGDSFTWGSEVTSEVAWTNVLSKILDCRVSNFGVPGYGTDQAYLRFTHNERDQAKIVLLGYFAENLVRNVIQFHDFLYPAKGFGLKPRFILENGSLKLIPFPQLSDDEYRAMVQDPARFLRYDYLLPGGPAGTSIAGFPHTISLVRVLGNYRVRAQLAGEPFWSAFYRVEHPSQALEITTLIMEAFFRDARQAGKTPIVVMLPWVLDLSIYQKNKRWVYQPLIDRLRERGIDVLNTGDGLADHLGPRSACDLYTACVGSHFNREGNEVTAKLIAEYLKKNFR